MAEALPFEVEERLNCSVCSERFKDPKVLPCLHSLCHDCIVKLSKIAESSTINCPECQLAVEVREISALLTLSLQYLFLTYLQKNTIDVA
jgi:hypothetical protein